MKIGYNHYFRHHYGSSFSRNDVINYRKWFDVQFNFFCKKINLDDHTGLVLELGSGIGGFYSFLSQEMKKNYTGLEIDIEAVQFSNKFFHTDSFIQSSIEQFQTNDVFRKIFAFEVLEHLENPLYVIDKIYTLLDTDGVFVGTSPFPFRKNIFADETHLFVLHPENWRKLFLNCGFNQVDIFPMSFFPYLWRLQKNLNVRIPLYISWPECISTALIIAKK